MKRKQKMLTFTTVPASKNMFTRVFSRAAPAGRRFMSGEAHHEEHVATMQAWKKRTFLALPFLGVLAAINVGIHMSHAHHEHSDKLPYSYEKKLLKKVSFYMEELY
jgi:hypothetical protein